MGTRFRKSIKIAPGIKINVGKKSAGISVGGKYGGMSFNSKNGARVRTSLPGTGISYSEKLSSSQTTSRTPAQSNIKKPLFQRTWFIVVAVLFVLGGFSQFSEDVGFAFFMLAVGVIMGVLSFLSFKESKAKASGQNEQTENEE